MSHRTIPLSRLQSLNGRNMHEALQTAVQATLHVEAEVEALSRLREATPTDERLPLDPHLLRATALALTAHPAMNARYSMGELSLFQEVNLGLTVARDDGVIVPVLHDVLGQSSDELRSAIRQIVATAREGHLRLHDTHGATFTVADVSDCEVDTFTPILPLGTVGILGMGRFRRVCCPADGACRPQSVTSFSLTFDHRAVHGVYAARFITSVIHHLRRPERLFG